MNQEITTELKWTTGNKITLNPQRSQCLVISPTNTNFILNIALYFNDSVVKINDTVNALVLQLTIN